MRTLADLLTGIPGVRLICGGETVVNGLHYDSRRVRPGDLFVAVRGEASDGALFIPQALARGAAALLLERETPEAEMVPHAVAADGRAAMALVARNFHDDPSSRLSVVGITGTNGKTTTSYIARSILASAGIPAGLVGTVQYLVGGQVISSSRTTPESVDLYAMLDAMAAAGDRACVMEVSSHALAQKRVEGMRMAAAVFTNLTQDHLDFHETMEEYFAAKSRLFHDHEVGTAIINRDDPWGARLLASLPGAVSFGMEGGDIRPDGEVSRGAWGSRFTLATPWGPVRVETSLAGAFNLANVMAAVGACGALGVSPAAMAEGILRMPPVPGRFQKVERGQGFIALVDYAHTPDALEKLLTNARELTRGRLLVVFGCGGDRDRGKRPLMGKVAGELADVVVLTSDNPRSEDPEDIIDQIAAGMKNPRAVVRRVPDRRLAIRQAVAEAEPGDLLAVAGKGHENYQVFEDRTLPFSDAEELEAAIVREGRVAG